MSAAGFLAASVPLRLANASSVVAIPILAVRQLGDVSLGGALVAASLAPAVLAAPLAGAWLDRARSPRILVMAAALVSVLGFASVSLLGFLPLPVIVTLLVLTGLSVPFYLGGISSFATDEIPDERRAYAFDALSYTVSSVGGPGIVALAMLSDSPSLAMWLMTAAALAGAAGTLLLRMPARALTAESVWRTIVAGTKHLVAHRPLAVVTVSSTLASAGVGALPIAAVAVSLERTGSVADAALIVTSFAVGGLVGALVAAVRPSSKFAPEAIMGVGFGATALFTLVAVPDLGLGWTLFAIGLSGTFTASTNAAMMLLRKQQSPLGVRSQVFTIGSGLRSMTGALGAAVAGLFAGVPAVALICGIALVWLVSAAIMLLFPRGAQPFDD